MDLTKKQIKTVIDVCINHLIREGEVKNVHITRRMINSYMFKKEGTVKTLSEVYGQLVGSLQNRNRMTEVIKLYRGLDDKFLLGYNHNKILKRYKTSIKRIRLAAKKHNPDVKTSGVLWNIFAKGVIDSSIWMLQFKNFDSFKKYLKPFEKEGITGLFLLVSSLSDGRITGMGPALAFDFIKGLGLKISKQCAKPDTHIKNTIMALGLCKRSSDGYEVVSLLSAMAKKVGVSTYDLDRLIWLSNSGLFYQHDIRLWSTTQTVKHRSAIVREIKKKWNIKHS